MASIRDLGYKIKLLLNGDSSKEEELCKVLDFSHDELVRLQYGRLALTPVQIKKTADFFSVSPESIVSYKNNDSYKEMVHCMSSFSSQEHCEEILDIIDSYIDIKEASC